MRKRAQGESILVEVLRVVDQRLNEVAGADIVSQIAEDLIAERIVTDVLNDAAAVGVSVGVLSRSSGVAVGKAGEQQRLDLLVPQQIDDLFVRQDGVGRAYWRERQRAKPAARNRRPPRMARNEDFHELTCNSSDSARQQQNHQNQKDKPESTRRIVTPAAAVGPCRIRPDRQYQQNHQENNQHTVSCPFALLLAEPKSW